MRLLLVLLFTAGAFAQIDVARRVQDYAVVKLTADLSGLAEHERKMIPHLIAAADQMDRVFWQEAWGDRESLFSVVRDPVVRRFLAINYGPWDRLGNNAPFVPGVGAKPKGARFYPDDMTKEEFEGYLKRHPLQADGLTSLYTLVRRAPGGRLRAIPYSIAFGEEHLEASDRLLQAAELARDKGLRRYLTMRAEALLTNEYQGSDLAWMDMTENRIEVVIGPIETYEDALFGYKAAHEAYVLVKDMDWSKRLARYAKLLPGLQRGLPVPDRYKAETPGANSQLNAYDVIYYAGDCNAGAKTIAINLPNDEQVQIRKGTRRLQLKNAMRAKFDRIMLPISKVLVAEDQRKHITFDAFFANTMFHEVAHGLGIKNTIDGKGTVRKALREQASALEEGKADVLGLYMITELARSGEIEVDLMDNYVTFLAGIFRSVRFGASSAHGRANMIRFNFFEKMGAFTRGERDGTYRIHPDRIQEAITALSRRILTFQGDGDHAGVSRFMQEMGVIGPRLQGDLDRLTTAGIPVDIVFEQGLAQLGL